MDSNVVIEIPSDCVCCEPIITNSRKRSRVSSEDEQTKKPKLHVESLDPVSDFDSLDSLLSLYPCPAFPQYLREWPIPDEVIITKITVGTQTDSSEFTIC